MPNRKETKTPKVSIADVASTAGVSKVAVSYVLNNRRGEVGVETRDRIMKAIRELGYRPPPSKQAQERGRCGVVGLVVGCDAVELARPSYYNSIFEGMLGESSRLGVFFTLFPGNMFDVDTADNVRTYCDGRCDGLVLLGLRLQSSLPAILDERGIPYVMIGDPREMPGSVSIDVDEEHGVRQLVGHLLNLGHKRIAFIGGPDFVAAAEIRLQIFQNLAPELGYTAFGLGSIKDYSTEMTSHWIRDMLAMPASDRPTAIITWNDKAGDYVLKELINLGIRVPEDVSIVRFDDAVADSSPLNVTSYRQPCSQIGTRALQLCIDRFSNSVKPPFVELIPGELIVRESSGPAPKAN